jgi:hypothetical protein
MILLAVAFASASMVLPIPPSTPIPCLICRATAEADATTFSGTVSRADGVGLRVYNPTTRGSMEFVAPADFRGVDSGDGVIRNAPLARATPGLLARVTYTSRGGRNELSHVLLLTVAQCRSLVASARLDDVKTACPD